MHSSLVLVLVIILMLILVLLVVFHYVLCLDQSKRPYLSSTSSFIAEYSDLYLNSDVLLLSDVFKQLRDTSLNMTDVFYAFTELSNLLPCQHIQSKLVKMRRSRSLSNIPMPCNAKRDSKSKRAKSTLRSRDPSIDGQTPLAYKLGSHTPLASGSGAKLSDQKYKMQKYLAPVTSTGFKRSGSVSSFGSRVSLTKNRSPREKKSMQKLLSDKKWVADQYTKVQAFIQTSGLFNPELSGMIRPPTINTIVELFSVLFGKLINKGNPINSQSYADVALKTLKLLNFPGSITLSTLKTVNTMHGWPHFIAIISWLIERVDLSSLNIRFREQQTEEIQRMFCLQDSVLNFLTTLHGINAGGQDTSDKALLTQIEEKLFEDMSALMGTDPEDVINLQQPIEICRAEVIELETKLQEITEENQKIEAQNLERRQIIKNFKESNSTKEQDLEVELSQLRKLRHKQNEHKKSLVLSIKELENIVGSQSCKYNEKVKILGQIEDLKRAIGRKERKLTEYRCVRDQLDHELTTMVKEIEAKVDAWNVCVTKTLLPEMQHLRLREKGFHSKDFVEELREVLKEKEEIAQQLQQEYKTIKFNLEKLQKKRESLIKNNKALNAIKEKIDSLKNSIQSSKEENRGLLFETDEVKKQFDTNIMKIEHLEGIKIKETETEMAELDDKIQKLTEKIDKSAKKGLGVLVEAHNMAIQNMQKIDEARHSTLKDISAKAEQSTNNLLETYNYLLSIQEKTASMLQDLNENNKETTGN